MKLKIIITIATLYSTTAHTNDIFIKNAQQKDIPAIIALDNEVGDEFFIPIAREGYPDLFANNEKLLHKVMNDEWDDYFRPIIKKATCNADNNNQHILIATHEKEPDKILGLCAFIKKEDYLYIQYLIVSQQARNKGIGKALLNNALSTYNDILVCKLETLAHNNESTQAFYEKYGFIKKEFCTFDKNMPNGHIRYELNLKK